MDLQLQLYATHYKQFLHKTYIITAARKDHAIVVKCSFNAAHFYHLLGFHKLVDVPAIMRIRDKYLFFKQALQNQNDFSCLEVKNSFYFDEVAERAACLMRLENILQQNIILRFDKRKAFTAINAELLLYEYFEQKYIHLFFKQSSRDNVFAPCSLFSNSSTKYIYHQEVYKILNVKIEDF